MIRRENINGDSPLKVVVEYMKTIMEDKASRIRLDEFEQGVKVGEFKILDLLVALQKSKK